MRDLDRLEAVGNAINSRIPRKSICCWKLGTPGVSAI